jgi:hypothetical protein
MPLSQCTDQPGMSTAAGSLPCELQLVARPTVAGDQLPGVAATFLYVLVRLSVLDPVTNGSLLARTSEVPVVL